MGGCSFGDAALGDVRRNRRLVQVAGAFQAGACSGGGGTISSVITDSHQAKAAYRLFDNSSVTHQAIVDAHCRHTRTLLDVPGVTLLIEDSTAISLPNRDASSGLGPIGEGFTCGFWLHTTLAVRYEESSDCAKPDRLWPIGLAHQQAWTRAQQQPAQSKSKESRHARQKRADRESTRWAVALALLPVRQQIDAQWIYVADRESDIYEVFGKCRAAAVSFVIRANQPRALSDKELGADVMSAAEAAPVRGKLKLELPRQDRKVKLEVRSASIELRSPQRPGVTPANFTLNVVRVREVDPPTGIEPIEWTLLTDLPVDTLANCQRVIGIYRARWMIEELHKGMKTGLGLELSQLSDYRRLSALAGLVSVTAVWLLQMKWSARTDEDRPLNAQEKKEAMVILLKKLHPPKDEMTMGWLWISIAKLGGYQARKNDGPPGWLTLWRGWQTLQIMLQGFELAE